jgi:V/A-type H+/Na+-transporting ATPase subunit D
VNTGATRWRLLELQRQRRAIDAGIDLLDRKRDALLRALAQRDRAAALTRQHLAAPLASARAALDRATVDIGASACRSAAVAQPPPAAVVVTGDAVVGVRVTRFRAPFAPFRPHYGPGGTSASLDEAGRAYAALLPDLLRLAEEERAARSLRRGLRRTARTLNALRAILRPAVDADIRAVASGLEEEEREEAVRWRARPPRAR